MAKIKKIVLGVTGSIAAYKSGDIIRRLREKSFDVSVVLTSEAERFITPLTLKSLSGRPVHRDMFDEKDESWDMNHISLAKEADVLLIAPATANTIGKIASGLADDLLSCIVLATQAKILIAPAMNTQMYKNKIVQSNIDKLKKLGMKFVGPVKGDLACGDVGAGHLAETKDIVSAVIQLAK